MMESLVFSAASPPTRNLRQSILRGWRGRCPNCGEGKLFRAYLKVADNCPHCGEELMHQRADDAPAYLTMFVVGHFLLIGVIEEDNLFPTANMLLIATAWSTLAVLASLWLLPHIKGALVGYQWAMRMHGFGGPVKDHE